MAGFKPWHGFVLVLCLVLAGAGAWLWAVGHGSFEIPLAELEARYSLPQSKFMDVDGIRVHYVDEGSGPAVVLLHASYMSLHTWNELAQALRDDYRVIRLDLLNNGLTGPDPSGQYSMERNVQLVEGITQALGVPAFSLLGTSSGAIVAFEYAGQHPDQVTRLLLVNAAGLPRTAVNDPLRRRGSALEQWIHRHYLSEAYWREQLEAQFSSGVEPPAELVRRVYDMNRRQGQREGGMAFVRNFKSRTVEPQDLLAAVRAPTLVMWGLGNIQLSALEADVFEHWLVNAPSAVRKYPKVGHYMYLEAPDEFGVEVRRFLAGEFDGDLRQTRRIVPGTDGEPTSLTGEPA